MFIDYWSFEQLTNALFTHFPSFYKKSCSRQQQHTPKINDTGPPFETKDFLFKTDGVKKYNNN